MLQLVFSHKEVNLASLVAVPNDPLSPLPTRSGTILTLPMERFFIDEVVVILLVSILALLVQCYE